MLQSNHCVRLSARCLAPALLFVLNQSALAVAKVSEVYVIRQNSRQGGLETVYLSSCAVRVIQENSGRVTIAHAPNWNAVVLNPANRTYFDSKNNTQALLMQRYMLLEGGDLSKVKWEAVERAKIAGVNAERYVDASCKTKKYDYRFECVPEELRARGFWVAADLKVAPAAANLIARIRGCPQIGKVPLRFVHVTRNKNHVNSVDTLSVQKKLMPLEALDIPAGYKRTLTEYDGELKDSGLLDELVPLSGKKR